MIMPGMIKLGKQPIKPTITNLFLFGVKKIDYLNKMIGSKKRETDADIINAPINYSYFIRSIVKTL